MSETHAPIRSYQRIFKPERRIYQVDGRRLPVPGGVPLGWLGWAGASVALIVLLSSRSETLTVLASAVAGSLGSLRSWRTALAAGCVTAVAVEVAGLVLGWLAWPLRLVVLPVAIATGASQVSGDGRPAHRLLISRVALRLRAERSSLQRPVAVDEQVARWAPRVWIAPDHRHPALHHGRVHGPARLVFAEEMILTRRRGRHVARPAATHRARSGDVRASVVELEEGQVVEVRP